MVLNVALLFNKKREITEGMPIDHYAEFDSEENINDLKNAIEKNRHNVILIEADEEAYLKLKENKEKIDFVFNFAEGLRGESRESQIPIFCEISGIPYLGPGPLTSAIILNKARTKEILSFYKIPTPNFQIFDNENEKINDDLTFPLLVKPIAEGSSKGLRNENLVKNKDELKTQIKKIINAYKQKALVEEYLDGREFTISLIGNENPLILPIVEIKFDHLPKNLHKFDHYEAKWLYDNPGYIKKNKINPIVCPAIMPKELKKKIREIALKTFKILDCKDWARVDIRLDKNNIPHVIEVNCPVGLINEPEQNSRMPKAAYALRWTYKKLVGEILNAGLKRYDLK